MRNLNSPRAIYFKAVLFLLTCLLACAIILLDYPLTEDPHRCILKRPDGAQFWTSLRIIEFKLAIPE
jgi:hypothetical protein